MKIGVDARNLVPSLTGIGRYVLEMCRHLALNGHELFLYLPEDPASSLPEWPRAIVRIGNYAGGIRRAIWGQTVLPRWAEADDVDIFWGPAHRLPFRLDRRIPRVVTIHDLVWMNAARTMRFQTWLGERILMKPAIRGADKIVTVSAATAEAVKTRFPYTAQKLRVVYPGLTAIQGDGSFTRFAAANQIDRPYALFVGTLEPRKNLRRLLEAYAELPERIRRTLLLVVAGGQGWRLDGLTALILELKIESFVRLTGYVSDAELAELYSNARFLVMPSLYEGFGFPIIEANARGIPVLTSNIASMPEVAGDAALLVNPLDSGSLTAGMMRLVDDEETYQRLASKSRLNASRFDWNISADSLLSVFNEVIK